MWPVFLLLLASAVKTNPVAPNDENSEVRQHTSADYVIGDPWFCLEKAKLKGRDMEILEVLPGFGWDNLRNMDEGQVVSFSYSKCRTTDDGLFLIPDSVSATPVKSSQVQYFAELMEHWKSWTSTNSKSINIDAGFSRKLVTISGKFSYEFTNIKSKQMNDKSSTIRTQLRYIRYSVKLQPDTPLHPSFKKRVEHIAHARLFKSQEQANFLSELLVRDFGTHMVTKADAGAALIQVQQVDERWLKEQSNSGRKGEVMASASAHFLNLLNMSAAVTFKEKTSEEFVNNYTSSITSSSVFTEGGPPFLPSDFTARNWAESLDKNLVALDRSGNPLHYVITEETLPGIPSSVLRMVSDGVKNAVRDYYAYNSVPGCLDATSPKYSPAANMDDNSCGNPSSDLFFGGVYQTCTMDINYNENGDICEKLRQVNPSTGDITCPTGYFSVKLHSGNTSSTRSENICTNYWLFSSCKDKTYESRAKYEMYWCFAQAKTSEQPEYLFGGLYTTKVDNSITGSASCPPAFLPLKIGDQAHLSICISYDKEFGKNKAVPLGGFYSCEVGNPFAADNRIDQPNVYYNKSSEWPKRCPSGFSAHLASVDQGCQINYCVTTGSLPGPALPIIKRPPFTPEPPLLVEQFASKFNFTPSSGTWTRYD